MPEQLVEQLPGAGLVPAADEGLQLFLIRDGVDGGVFLGQLLLPGVVDGAEQLFLLVDEASRPAGAAGRRQKAAQARNTSG